MNKYPGSSLFAALCALALFSSPAHGQTIVNPSFETDASSGSGTAAITGWPFTAGSGGINDSTGPFADNGVIPDGSKVAFIHFAGTMHQVVAGFTPGLQYRLRYAENARLGAGTANVQVSVGGVPVVATHQVVAVGGSSPYLRKTTEAFTATAASLDVVFVVSGSGDFTVLLDKVEIFQNRDVTNSSDTGPGSLRQTILDAPAGSTITFAPGVAGTVGMLAGKITIDKNLTIVGPGSSKFILANARGDGVDTGSGVDNRIFEVNTGVKAAISGLTVTGGRTIEVAASGSTPGGGGISNNGTLTLTDVTISDCSALGTGYNPGVSAFGGGIRTALFGASVTLNNCTVANNKSQIGGGVYGKVTINNSLIQGNLSEGNPFRSASGGGLYLISTSSINNSTISGNTALGYVMNTGGGGLAANTNSTVTLTNSTVSGNSATTDAGGGTSDDMVGGGILVSNWHLILINSTVTNNVTVLGAGATNGPGDGAGIFIISGGDVTMRNSILAGNTKTGAVNDIVLSGTSTTPFISQGYNLIGSAGTVPISGTTTGNIVGTNAAPANARLTPLGFYGGVTPTHALLTTSPAINAGNIAPSPAADQRGAARVGTADIGAFELNNTANAGTYVAILPQGVLTVPYTYTLVANNVAFSSTFTSTVTSGALPGGLSLTTTSNVVTIAGTPTAAGIFNLAITVSNGTITNITNYRLTVLATPALTAINPASGSASGGDSVTITGTGFTGATEVSIGGAPVISFSIVSDTSITAFTPAHAPGLASVLASNGGSANPANTLYTYLPGYTQAQYDANRTAGQNDVTTSPGTYNLYTAAQYTGNYTSGQNSILNSPNTYSLYTLSQVQALHVGVPLLTKDAATGLFTLTLGVEKSTDLSTFAAFPLNTPGFTTTINAAGKLEFRFPVPDNAAFFRVQHAP